MANHPNRNKLISGSRRFVAAECARQHDIHHDRAVTLGNHAARDAALSVAAQWSLTADRVVNSSGALTLRVPIGQSVYTITVTG
jgi:hypothetical protein